MNILFVCSRNKWRSRTAEAIFKNNGKHIVQSTGTSKSARIRINQIMINWADVIFVMEPKHKSRILESFDFTESDTEIDVLDIPDEYQYMDVELVAILKIKLSDIFK